MQFHCHKPCWLHRFREDQKCIEPTVNVFGKFIHWTITHWCGEKSFSQKHKLAINKPIKGNEWWNYVTPNLIQAGRCKWIIILNQVKQTKPAPRWIFISTSNHPQSAIWKTKQHSKHMPKNVIVLKNQLDINNYDYSPTAGSFPKPKMYSTQN